MDSHDKAHYGIAGIIAAGAVALGLNAGHIERSVHGVKANVSHVAAHEWADLTIVQRDGLAKRLERLPAHEITIYCTSGCGVLPEDLEAAFKAAGWQAHIESAIGGGSGVSVSPDNAEGRAVADAISSATGITATLADQDGGTFAVAVGRKGK